MIPSLDSIRRVTSWAVLGAVLLGLAGFALPSAPLLEAVSHRPIPEFKNQQLSAWINSTPLTRGDLRGQVVMIEIWTSV